MITQHSRIVRIPVSIVFTLAALVLLGALVVLTTFYQGTPAFGPMLRSAAHPAQIGPLIVYHYAIGALIAAAGVVGIIDLTERCDAWRDLLEPENIWAFAAMVGAGGFLALRDGVAAAYFMDGLNRFAPPENYGTIITVGCWITTVFAYCTTMTGLISAFKVRFLE